MFATSSSVTVDYRALSEFLCARYFSTSRKIQSRQRWKVLFFNCTFTAMQLETYIEMDSLVYLRFWMVHYNSLFLFSKILLMLERCYRNTLHVSCIIFIFNKKNKIMSSISYKKFKTIAVLLDPYIRYFFWHTNYFNKLLFKLLYIFVLILEH